MSDWISVKDRLPEPWASVLVHMPGKSPFLTAQKAYFLPPGRWIVWGHPKLKPGEITHWMPMPEGPDEA